MLGNPGVRSASPWLGSMVGGDPHDEHTYLCMAYPSQNKWHPVKNTGKKWKQQICPFLIKGSCKFGTKCKNPHTRGGFLKKSIPNTGESWRRLICPYFYNKSCKFGIRCRNPHSRGDCIASNNDSTTNCRVSTHRSIGKPFTSKNRFDPLQETNVSQEIPLMNTRGKKSKSKGAHAYDSNPTGDIWDQTSLNLNTLFRVENISQVMKQNNFRIGIWNAQSVRLKENLIKQYILDHDLDIFIILESWLERDELPSTRDVLPSIDSYKLHQLPRPDRTNSSGGGMLCIYKENIKIKKLPTIQMKLLETMDLKLESKDRSIRIVPVYRPPSSKKRKYPISNFYDDMENLVSYYKTMKDEVIFCGDYNVHVNKPNNAETCRFNSIIESAELQQHVTEKTHNKGNTLDLVLSDQDSTTIKKCVVGDFMSDHAVIILDLDMAKPPKSKKQIRFRKNKDVDIKQLESQIDENLKEIGNINDLAELVDKFNHALSDAYNKQAPLITKNVIVRPPTPWTYDDIKEDKATRRKLERRWRLTGLQIDHDRFREFRNKYTAKLNNFRNKQYAEMIEKNKDDPTTLFRVINKSLHRNQSSPLPSGLTNSQLAEKFSEFFSEKIDNIRAGIDEQQNQRMDDRVCEEIQSSSLQMLSEFKLLTEKEVEEIIKDFPNKQCGLDPLPLSMLKECLPIVLGHITKIVNLSLKIGDLSHNLKRAIIVPLLKKLGLELELKNYRPVSNLSFLSKLIEKIVAGQFVDHLIKNKLFDPLQSAYRKGHSTETALLKVQNDILIDIDNNNVSILVMLDLSAAFDTIDHEVLLKRLESHYGIKGKVLKWFRSYLTDRSQSIIIDDEISEPKQLKYGVPQGSVLGPLLFTAYMAPMKNVINKYGLRYHCYADDTQLYISFSPIAEDERERVVDSLEQAIHDIKNFMIANKLKLNDDKTEVIFLGTKYRLDELGRIGVTVGDSVIYPSDKVRNLGVVFDKHLSMEDQVKSVYKQGFYHIKNLWRIRKFLNEEQANVAAHAFITSKLDYGNALLGGAPKFLINKMQLVQNAAARVVTKTGKYEHISHKLRDMKWLPVAYRIKYKLNVLTWKAQNGQAPEYISDLISERAHGIDLRSGKSKVLNVPKTNLKTIGDKAFSVVAPKSWNLLPKELRMSGKLQSFKAGLKSLYLKEAYSTLD